MSSSLATAPRVAPNQWHALGGIWRLTARRFCTRNYWLSVGALLTLFAVLTLSMVSRSGAAGEFFGFITSFYLGIVVPVIAFVTAAGAIRDELKPGSVDYVFTRPVRRPAFVSFKYLAQMACLQVDFLLTLVVLIGLGIYRHVPGLMGALPMLLLTQVLLVVVLSAFGFLAGILTSRYVIVGLVYAAVVEIGMGRIPTQLNKIAMIKQGLGMLKPLLHRVAPALAPDLSAAPGVLATVVLLLGVAAAMLALAALLFSRQEFAGGQTAQS